MYCDIILRSNGTAHRCHVMLLLLLLCIRCLFGILCQHYIHYDTYERHYDIMKHYKKSWNNTKGTLEHILAALIAKILFIVSAMPFYYYSHIIKILVAFHAHNLSTRCHQHSANYLAKQFEIVQGYLMGFSMRIMIYEYFSIYF